MHADTFRELPGQRRKVIEKYLILFTTKNAFVD